MLWMISGLPPQVSILDYYLSEAKSCRSLQNNNSRNNTLPSTFGTGTWKDSHGPGCCWDGSVKIGTGQPLKIAKSFRWPSSPYLMKTIKTLLWALFDIALYILEFIYRNLCFKFIHRRYFLPLLSQKDKYDKS